MTSSNPKNTPELEVNKIFKGDNGERSQWQGTTDYLFTTTQEKDGSFKRSGWIGNIDLDSGSFMSSLLGNSSAELEFSASYTPEATKTSKSGGEYLGNGVSAPIESTTQTSSREEIIVFRIPPGNNHPIFDHSEWEHTGTWEFLYNDYPNSDDSEVDGYKDSKDPLVKTSPTTNRSGLTKFNMEHLLPNNWWEKPFEIVSTKSSDQSDNS